MSQLRDGPSELPRNAGEVQKEQLLSGRPREEIDMKAVQRSLIVDGSVPQPAPCDGEARWSRLCCLLPSCQLTVSSPGTRCTH